VNKPVAKKLANTADPIGRRQRVCVEQKVLQIEVKVGAMASDRCRAKASLLEPMTEFAKKGCILLADLLTTFVVLRFVVEHQISLIGAGPADAGRIGHGLPPMLPGVRQQPRRTLQGAVSMARWHRGKA
jgi:hypothetical protein